MTKKTTARPEYDLNAEDFKKMILGANLFFHREKDKINALNVFPVPDGDTGTNMSLTLSAVVDESVAYEGQSIGELSSIVASRALMGARGNSGVILSQLLRGIAHGLRKKDQISPAELSKAFQYGVVYAYRAVSKPVEGTILTVAREMARGIRIASRKGENLHESLEEAVRRGKITLAKTRDMLPALKNAGVVDAGGLGLLVFFEGCLFALKRSVNDIISAKPAGTWKTDLPPSSAAFLDNSNLHLDYPYCTELMIESGYSDFSGLKDDLENQGDSLLVVTDALQAKVHIHTAEPGKILTIALKYGALHDIKIENMQEQVEANMTAVALSENRAPETCYEHNQTGLIAISFGDGFRDIFLNLGASEVVFGGQTMNPKVEDLLKAIEELPQQSVIMLPNNKNIIMVAQQAAVLTTKNVFVVETRTLPEGLAALLSYKPAEKPEKNISSMLRRIKEVKSGAITYATRDALIKGKKVNKNDFLGLTGDQISVSGKALDQTALNLASSMLEEGGDILTVFYGTDLKHHDAEALTEVIRNNYPDLEIELHYGGQPVYYYIFSIE